MVDTCPDDGVFSALLDGTLSDEERDALDAHLDSCGSCATLVVELARQLETGPGDDHIRSGPSMPRLERPVSQPMQIDRFEIRRMLGAGAMGIVYEAWDPMLARRVALKLLRAERFDETQQAHQLARMHREAQLLAAVDHPHVLPIYDVGTLDEQTYLAVRFVDGDTLDAHVRKHALTWRETLSLYLKAGAGIAAAHDKGLIHRDIKPANILVENERGVWVTDFGLARTDNQPPPASGSALAHASTRASALTLTETGAMLGTPAYMAPEVYNLQGADARSDQFSFCVSIYESLYGHRPFAGDTIAAMCVAICRGELRDPPVDSEVPQALFTILSQGMQTDPNQRFVSMGALLQALHHVMSPGRQAPTRRQAWWLAAALSAILALGMITWSLTRGDEPAAPVDVEAPSRTEPALTPSTFVTDLNRLDPRVQKAMRCAKHEFEACEAWAQMAIEQDTTNGEPRPMKGTKGELSWSRLYNEAMVLEKQLYTTCHEHKGGGACLMAAWLPSIQDGQGKAFEYDTHPQHVIDHVERGCRHGETIACSMVYDIFVNEHFSIKGIDKDLARTEHVLGRQCRAGHRDVCWLLSDQTLWFANAMDNNVAQRWFQTYSELGCQQGDLRMCIIGLTMLQDVPAADCRAKIRALAPHMKESLSMQAKHAREHCDVMAPVRDDEAALALAKRGCQIRRPATLRSIACDAANEIELRRRDATTLRARCEENVDACEAFAVQILEVTTEGELVFERPIVPAVGSARGMLLQACEQGGAESCALVALFDVMVINQARDYDDATPRDDAIAPYVARMERACLGGSTLGCLTVRDAYGYGYFEDNESPFSIEDDLSRMYETLEPVCQRGHASICLIMVEMIAIQSAFRQKHGVAQYLRWACDAGDGHGCAVAAVMYGGGDSSACLARARIARPLSYWYTEIGADDEEDYDINEMCSHVAAEPDPEWVRHALTPLCTNAPATPVEEAACALLERLPR